MPQSDYTYVSGVPLQFGTEGRNELVFHSGEPVPDRGGESYLIESGTALGGNLVRRFKFDETSGTIAEDNTNSNDAEIGSAVTLGQPGKDGTSFEFTPSSIDSIVDNRDDNIDFQEITVSCWIKITNKGSPDNNDGGFPTQQVYEQENTVELYLDEEPGGTFLKWSIDGNGVSPYNFDSHLGDWAFLTGTFSQPTSRLYVNGSQVRSFDTGLSLSPVVGGYTIGREYSDLEGDQRLNGLIDDVRIYQVELEPSAVQDLYNSY